MLFGRSVMLVTQGVCGNGFKESELGVEGRDHVTDIAKEDVKKRIA